jgi:cytochrome c oxidase assembly protein subunit 11
MAQGRSVTESTKQRSANRRLSLRLMVVAVAMFGFGYTILPLLYDAVCELTGLGGRPAIALESQLSGVTDTERLVTVQFLGTVNSSLPWDVQPTVTEMRINPGRLYDTTYFARNLSSNGTVGTATPTITPTKAALYFTKTECFCFSQQSFDGGEGREMPVRFVVGAGLPADIHTITLSYTFFNAAARS